MAARQHLEKQQSSEKHLQAYTRPFITLIPDLTQAFNSTEL